VIGNAEPVAAPDPVACILALEELRDLGLLDDDEFAAAAADTLAEERDRPSAPGSPSAASPTRPPVTPCRSTPS
jgi:hypothetical protein